MKELITPQQRVVVANFASQKLFDWSFPLLILLKGQCVIIKKQFKNSNNSWLPRWTVKRYKDLTTTKDYYYIIDVAQYIGLLYFPNLEDKTVSHNFSEGEVNEYRLLRFMNVIC